MITLHLTEAEAEALLAVAGKLRTLLPGKGGQRRARVAAFIQAHSEIADSEELARLGKKAGIWSRSAWTGDIVRTIERYRKTNKY